MKTKYYKEIILKNDKSDIIKRYKTISDLCEDMDISQATVYKYIKLERPYKGYLFEMVKSDKQTEEPTEEPTPEQEVQKLEIRFLPDVFYIGQLEYSLVKRKLGFWNLYKVLDKHRDKQYYTAFKHKTAKSDDILREVRPAPKYEGDDSWFIESDRIDECLFWLLDNC